MKYQWTDWITHVPGQQLPVGTYGIWEQVGRSGVPHQTEAMITAAQKNHPTWFATDRFGKAKMLTRYKLRSIALEDETIASAGLELVE
jgi:hypothetical protein